MKKQLVIIGIIASLICVELSGCTTSDKDKIVGTWRISGSDEFWLFLDNSTMATPAGTYYYRFENGSLIIEMNTESVLRYRFSGNDDLVLTYIEPLNLYGHYLTLTRKL